MIKLALGSLMLSMVFSLSLYAAAENTLTDSATETVFPREITFRSGGKDYHLQATGVSSRKKMVFKLYGVAHYLQDASSAKGDKFQAVLDPSKAKQLTLKWVRDVPADKIQSAYRESVADALSEAESTQLKPQIDQYVGFFSEDVKKGDEQVIRWTPGGHIEVILNGKSVGDITNEAFAKALWTIWFGNHSVVKRDALVSEMK